jgi:CRP-like cAMP-binding protein
LIGIVSLLPQVTHGTTVHNLSDTPYEPSKLVHIGRDRLLAFLKQRPDALLRIVQLLCARLRRLTHLVEDSIFRDVSTRLARQIVALTDARVPPHDHHATATLHLSQNDLARMLGVSRECVGKQLTAWRDSGVVELGRRRITIRDAGALERLCAGERQTGRPCRSQLSRQV